MHDSLNVGANSIDFSVNEPLTVRPRRVGVNRHAIETELDDILCGHERRRHSPRHEIVVRIFQRANGHMSKAVQYPLLDENSARHDKIGNALLVGIALRRSMLRRDARLRRRATQGNDQKHQRETVSRAPHAGVHSSLRKVRLRKIKDYSALRPVASISWPHRLWSASMMRRISLGLLGAGSRPAPNRTFCASGIAAILAISALSTVTRSSGVPRGANSASHEETLKLGTPASRSVGIFGMECERTDSATPKATTWPLLIIGKIEAVSNNPKGTSPEAIATAAGAPPR